MNEAERAAIRERAHEQREAAERVDVAATDERGIVLTLLVSSLITDIEKLQEENERLRAIALGLVSNDDPESDPYWSCVFCRGDNAAGADLEEHDADCAYRLAREYATEQEP
jgi:hypothetical protein